MQNPKPFSGIFQYMQKNLFLYIISLLFLCIGIVLGIYAVKYMGESEKHNLIDYILQYTNNINSVQVSKKQVFLQALKNNIPFLIIIWFLGLSMIGIPIILILDGIKGFTMGFTASFMINCLGSKGILVNLLTVFPQNIIYIPCIVIISVAAMEFSLNLLKNNSLNNLKPSNNLMKIMPYSTVFLIILCFMTIGFILEGYLTSSILKLIVMETGCVFA
ncbi:stage II sporulation protein M [Clostridium sp. MB40-C1]|uniref:stage II sporulation protein M n=1 Tax=Clostridium sp. MB40-C1 TaxID=3070996 RepID=UPI0027DF44FC|nr:stage II sporulation protein M [Clostridium sp. MB40-C1]WMJ81874.1 stage II sporulation protein M [Clostridium sp. MB40-C1]